jgi:AraC-like DNA-binding protein
MPGTQKELTDVTVHGPHTHMRGVQAANVESRPWIKNFPVCPILAQYQIVHLGVEETRAPMKIVRTNQTTTYFLACIRGRGRVLIDGRWRICREGHACLLPAHTLNAFEVMPNSFWEFCWVCYHLPDQQRPIAGATTPVIARYDPLPLSSAILGLMHESNGPARPELMHEWADLVHAYVLTFAQPAGQPDQLKRLWDLVAANPAHDWSLGRLASEAGYSNEHLRRLCQRQLGRSPMQQVIYLRMRHAAERLRTADWTLEAVAREVGYQNPFVFSNAFTRWIGWRPSEYRRKKTKQI